MTYVTGRGRFDYKVAVDRLARDLAGILPGAETIVRDEWRATLAVDGVAIGMEADACEGIVRARILPAGVDFDVAGPRGPVDGEDIEYEFDPRGGLEAVASDVRAALAETAPLVEAMRAFAARRRRVADGPGEWMGAVRIGGRFIALRPGGGWDWYVREDADQHPTYWDDHLPQDRGGETLLYRLVQWLQGRGDNPHFTRPMTPEQVARADCICQRALRTRQDHDAADRAIAAGREREWVRSFPLPALTPVRPEAGGPGLRVGSSRPRRRPSPTIPDLDLPDVP